MKRAMHNLSHAHPLTLNAGDLVPFFLQDTLPNDTFYLSQDAFIRAQPMLAPLLHNIDILLQYWFVPERIIWDEAEAFWLGLNELEGLPAPVRPTIKAPEGGFTVGSLADYFGFPTGENHAGIEVSALPFRAYTEIWNSRYRVENLQDEVNISYDSNIDTETNTELLSPAWHRDYFMKADITTQRGSEIQVPILTSSTDTASYSQWSFTIALANSSTGAAMTKYSGTTTNSVRATFSKYANATLTFTPNSSLTSSLNSFISQNVSKMEPNVWYSTGLVSGQFSSSGSPAGSVTITNGTTNVVIRLNSVSQQTGSNVGANISFPTYSNTGGTANPDTQNLQSPVLTSQFQATALYNNASVLNSGTLPILNLRRASAMQRFQERSLKWGNRYEEMIMREFGIKPRDSRIDRPEYLGGSRGKILFSEVLQTSEGAEGGVGSMYGHGVGKTHQRTIKFKCPEHGIIIGIMSIRPRFAYKQGVAKAWLKKSRFEFFFPEFADIGMQEIMQQELYATKDNADVIFGYTDRYDEYRKRFDVISGEFRTILNHWNMAVEFDAPPSLNGSFVSMEGAKEAFKRPFLVPSEHQYLAYINNRVLAARCVPKFAKTSLS